MLMIARYIDQLIDDASLIPLPHNMGKIAAAYRDYTFLFESAVRFGWVTDFDKWKPYGYKGNEVSEVRRETT